MDISNKSLALILIASILISVGGTFTALIKLDQLRGTQIITGFASTGATGQANVTVSSQIALTAIANFMNFGGGFANGSTCRLNSTNTGLPIGNTEKNLKNNARDCRYLRSGDLLVRVDMAVLPKPAEKRIPHASTGLLGR